MRTPRAWALAVAAAFVVARSAAAVDVVVVVAATSAVDGAVAAEIGNVFLGRAGAVPAAAALIPIDQPEGSPAREQFYSRFAGMSSAQVKAHWAKLIFTGRGQPPVTVPGDAEVKKRLAQNPRAVGYIDRASVDPTVRILAPSP